MDRDRDERWRHRSLDEARVVPRALGAVLLVVGLTGCPLPSADTDAGAPDAALPADDAALDASASDASTGTGTDAATYDAGSLEGDASDDAAVDAWLDCASCEAPGPCRTLTCVSSCEYTPLADGTTCGPSEVCALGRCVARGCGDRIRRSVSTGTELREGCDDGDNVDGDACSSTCAPTAMIVPPADADREGTPTAQLPAIAESGDGSLLFVWLDAYESGGEVHRRLLAERYDDAGNALLAPTGDRAVLVLEDPIGVSQPVRPSVDGTPEGWVVTWRSTAVEGASGEQGGIAYRLISASTGAMSPTRLANRTTALDQLDPRVATLSTGFVIVWTDTSAELVSGDLRMRFFGTTGIATTGELDVTSVMDGDQSAPFVVSHGTAATPTDTWTVAWTDTSSGTPLIAMRRFVRMAAADAHDIAVSHEWSYGPSLGITTAGEYVAWTRRSVDTTGDVCVLFVAHTDSAPADSAPDCSASSPAASETTPTVTAYPSDGSAGYLAAYATNAAPRGGRITTSPGLALPPEAADLSALLQSGQSAFSLTPTERGLWAAWSDPSRTPAPSVFVAYLMPWN